MPFIYYDSFYEIQLEIKYLGTYSYEITDDSLITSWSEDKESDVFKIVSSEAERYFSNKIVDYHSLKEIQEKIMSL